MFEPPTTTRPTNRAPYDRAGLGYWAWVSCLVGGVLIIAAALMMLFLAPFGNAPSLGYVWRPAAYEFGTPAYVPFTFTIALWGLICGGVVLASAWQLRRAGEAALVWGIVALVGGLLSFPAGGGFLIGALLAAVGGILAIVSGAPRGGYREGRDVRREGPLF